MFTADGFKRIELSDEEREFLILEVQRCCFAGGELSDFFIHLRIYGGLITSYGQERLEVLIRNYQNPNSKDGHPHEIGPALQQLIDQPTTTEKGN